MLTLTPPTRNPAGPHPDATAKDHGFTLVELAIATALMLVIMLVFLSLISPSQKSSNVANALITNEQDVTLALQQMEKDIRAANPLDAFNNNCYDDQIELTLGPTGGTQQTVMWVYSPTTDTLAREVVTGSGCNPTVSGEQDVTTIVNGTTPVFAYFNSDGTQFNPEVAPLGDIANCTVRVTITLIGQANTDASPFTEKLSVWLRNRLPGGMPGCA
jgi:prepilin-type N-terminal cleavage/methylation domain-containing protein